MNESPKIDTYRMPFKQNHGWIFLLGGDLYHTYGRMLKAISYLLCQPINFPTGVAEDDGLRNGNTVIQIHEGL